MKLLILAILLTGLTGCGPVARLFNDWEGKLTPYCYNGTTYLALGTHALAVAYDENGKPLRCSQ